MTKYKKWTAADDAELVLMREAKTPTKEIATALGRTPSSVMNRISTKAVPYGKEPTFREVVDTAFAKHEIEFGEPDGVDAAYEHFKQRLYPNGLGKSLNDMGIMLNQMEKDIKPKPQWWKAMMWWRK